MLGSLIIDYFYFKLFYIWKLNECPMCCCISLLNRCHSKIRLSLVSCYCLCLQMLCAHVSHQCGWNLMKFVFTGYDRKRQCIVHHPYPGVHDISGVDILDNHSVNLLASLITSLLAPRVAFHLWRYFSWLPEFNIIIHIIMILIIQHYMLVYVLRCSCIYVLLF